MHQLCRSAVLKRKRYTRAKISVFRSVFVSILIYGHECWTMTERVRSRVQTTEIGFLQKVSGLSQLDKVKSTDICQSLNIKLLLLCIEQSQLRWYGNVTRMSHEQLSKQLMDALLSGKSPRGGPRTCWRNSVKDMACLRLGIPQAELPLVADQDVWRSQLELLPLQPQKDKRAKKNFLN